MLVAQNTPLLYDPRVGHLVKARLERYRIVNYWDLYPCFLQRFHYYFLFYCIAIFGLQIRFWLFSFMPLFNSVSLFENAFSNSWIWGVLTVFWTKINSLFCHRKLIETRGKYEVGIGETVLISLIAVIGCANRVLVTKYTPFLCYPSGRPSCLTSALSDCELFGHISLFLTEIQVLFHFPFIDSFNLVSLFPFHQN